MKLPGWCSSVRSVGRRHLVEFRAGGGQSQVLERLDSRQFTALGWSVTPTGYGLRIDYDGETIIFTPWPVDAMFQQSSLVAAAIRDPVLLRHSHLGTSRNMAVMIARGAGEGTSDGADGACN